MAARTGPVFTFLLDSRQFLITTDARKPIPHAVKALARNKVSTVLAFPEGSLCSARWWASGPCHPSGQAAEPDTLH